MAVKIMSRVTGWMQRLAATADFQHAFSEQRNTSEAIRSGARVINTMSSMNKIARGQRIAPSPKE